MGKPVKDHSSLFLWLTVFFVTSLLLSNIIAGKLITVFGIVLPSAVILFPVTYIMGDVFTEVYGFAKTRTVIWAGFLANLLMSLVFMLVVALPSPGFFTGQAAYAAVLGFAPRAAAASLIAYIAGEFTNSITLSAMKKLTHGRFLWTRTISSTVAGQGVDTLLFITIAFAGIVPHGVLLSMIICQYLFKVAYEAALTPVTCYVIGVIKRKEGIDVYDYHATYNPFTMKE